jgi:hypothetical protein
MAHFYMAAECVDWVKGEKAVARNSRPSRESAVNQVKMQSCDKKYLLYLTMHPQVVSVLLSISTSPQL